MAGGRAEQYVQQYEGGRDDPAPGFIAYLLQKYGLDRLAQ